MLLRFQATDAQVFFKADEDSDLFEQVYFNVLDTDLLTNKIKIRLKLSINVTIRSKLKKL